MKAYVDASALLRLVLGGRGPLSEWKRHELALANELVRVEALRTIDRARILLQLPEIARLEPLVLQRAANPFPTLIRTLDAIHLATAQLVRLEIEDLVFATHDEKLALAARALGFRVIGAS